jgi:choline dehydrogenase-like flavoprotein
MTEAHSNPEHVDVLIVGSGPAGSTYARVVGDARPDVSILVVEAGPRLRGSLGEHTSNMSPVDRRISQRLAQGPDAGVDRPPPHLALSATDRPAGTAPFIFPGLFPVGGGAAMPGEFGLPAAAMSTGVGGMGVHWSASTPRPSGSERNPFIPSAET